VKFLYNNVGFHLSHRDIKPSNLFLNDRGKLCINQIIVLYVSCAGRIVIGDFNVACIVTPGTPVTSKAGTRSYMGNINSVTIILFCYVSF